MNFAPMPLAPIVAFLLVFPACSPHYQRPHLPIASKISTPATPKNNISINAHHMTRSEIHQTFGTRGRKLGYYGLCPIQLSIKNNSVDTLIFDPAHVTLPYANHADVAACMQNRTVFTTASLAGLGLLAAGTVCLYTLPFALWFYVTGIVTSLLYVGAGAAAGILILTPTVVVYYTKQASAQNRAISKDIKDIALTHTRTIRPDQELNVILFTKKENCKKDFAITLINEATQESTIFNMIKSPRNFQDPLSYI